MTTASDTSAATIDGTCASSGCTPLSGRPSLLGTKALPNDGRSHHGGSASTDATSREPMFQPTFCFGLPSVLTSRLRFPSRPCTASSMNGGSQSTTNRTVETSTVRRTLRRNGGQPVGIGAAPPANAPRQRAGAPQREHRDQDRVAEVRLQHETATPTANGSIDEIATRQRPDEHEEQQERQEHGVRAATGRTATRSPSSTSGPRSSP